MRGNLGDLNPAELFARGLDAPPSPDSDGWNSPEPAEFQRMLPQYKIEAIIGRGGMGVIYRGIQTNLRRSVAIKVLPAELAEDANFVSRFEREARTLAQLEHPGIVHVYDFGKTSAGHLYFVMEFVEGADLRQIIRGPGLDAAQALELIGQICDALQYAHSKGVVHRDIKPANILVTREGRVKVCDFGLARPLDSENSEQLTLSRLTLGTPDYMAPEQKRGEGDHRIDLYALGVMLYEMLCGHLPQGAWEAPSRRARTDVRLDTVVMKAMQEDPERRYQQASEVKTAVDFIRNSPAPIDTGTLTNPSGNARKRLLLIGALCVIPLIAGGLWLATPEKRATAISQWQPVWKPVYGPGRLSDPEHPPHQSGWISLKSTSGQMHFVKIPFSKGLVRLRVKWLAGSTVFQCALGEGETDYSALDISSDNIRFLDNKRVAKPVKAGDVISISLAWIGNETSAWVDGERVGVRTARQRPENFTMRGNIDNPSSPEEVQLRDIEWVDLSGLSATEAKEFIDRTAGSPGRP